MFIDRLWQRTDSRRGAQQSCTAAALIGMMLVFGACQASGGSQAESFAVSATPTSSMASAAASALCATLPANGLLTVQTGDISRQALVHLPASTADGTPFPVVLVLHGYTDTAQGAELLTQFSEKADEAGFLAVYPQGRGNPSAWDIPGASDTAFIDALLTKLSQDRCVDATRIYATGFSMGGGMVGAVGCRLSGRIAAIAPVSGLYGPGFQGPCAPTRPVPVIAFHGVIDSIAPYLGGSIPGSSADSPQLIAVESWAADWAKRNRCDPAPMAQPAIGQVVPLFWQGCAAPVELYRINDGRHSWPGSKLAAFMLGTEPNRDIVATDLIWDFFSAQSLPAT